MDIDNAFPPADSTDPVTDVKKVPRKPRPSELAKKAAKAAAKEAKTKPKPKAKKRPAPNKKAVKKLTKRKPKAKAKKAGKRMGKKPKTGAAALTHRLDLRVNRATKAKVTAYAKKKAQTISAVVIGFIDKLK